jgi:transcriptional regulator with XRE-family HTH domain
MPNGTSIQRTKTKVATDSASESVAGVSVINAASGNQSLGNDIRALRKSRSLTLQELAEKLQRSVGFVSQLERGLSEPSISDLRNIATIFEVPISLFFGESPGDPLERGFVVRAGSRRKLGGADADLVEELLSPDLGGSFEIIRSEFAPGAWREEVITRDTEEAGYVVSGDLDLEIDGQWLELHPGDSFRYAALPIRWKNRGEEAAVVIWVISPPVY